MIIRVINQLRDDSFPGKIISKGQVATGGHFVDKVPRAQNILLPLEVGRLTEVEFSQGWDSTLPSAPTAPGEPRGSSSLLKCKNISGPSALPPK